MKMKLEHGVKTVSRACFINKTNQTVLYDCTTV